jgi:hypothetical protein
MECNLKNKPTHKQNNGKKIKSKKASPKIIGLPKEKVEKQVEKQVLYFRIRRREIIKNKTWI